MIQQLARQLMDDIDTVINSDRESGASTLKALLEARLRKLNLVSREEFDAQSAVLARTREQLQVLERQLAELEAQIREKDAG